MEATDDKLEFENLTIAELKRCIRENLIDYFPDKDIDRIINGIMNRLLTCSDIVERY